MQSDIDKELLNPLMDRAQRAASKLSDMSIGQIEKIVRAVAQAASEQSEFYAEWAVRETGYGRVASKIEKNRLNSVPWLTADVSEYIRPRVLTEEKMVEIPKPAGVIMALIPVTNPVCTVFFKSLIALQTRNAIILSPHPGAKACSTHALNLLHDAAVAAGAPPHALQIIPEPTVPLVQALMADERNNLTLATGGPAMVRAAYSSSNPAIGVGPGNVPAYVDRTADIEQAAARIVRSKSFDNSLLCTSESVVIADLRIAQRLKSELVANKAHIVECSEQRRKLREYVYPDGRFNVAVLGKDADVIATGAGIDVPEGTLVLILPITSFGRHEPFIKEKMCPILGYIEVGNAREGIKVARAMLDVMGKGHSAVLHANDPRLAVEYGRALPVCRISVNAEGVLGSSGVVTNLNASATIGTGFFGRSSVDRNVGAESLVQWTRVAYNTDPSEVLGDMEGAVRDSQAAIEAAVTPALAAAAAEPATHLAGLDRDLLKSLLREILTEELSGSKTP
ncbi:aldehyde dehydrogenase family protein [Ruegeria sp. Ofav3-42]|uniref:aldehyde dehydrogenase family protein n=1 Tax=Ruegeria sp. Ofav3-42 TaxID=2917759 RepID=UPI001EF4A3A5|nr:aldehyde dehydrogenase family protein [Ruegeria sp. Ofav3-42]MCG7521949.1 aldehyde dehydrogenase family protein [Ruegeria sp. Ofav3-42]